MRYARSLAFLILASPLLVARPGPAVPPSAAEDEKLLKANKVATDGPGLLAYFRKHTLSDADLRRLQALIVQLGDESFKVRQKASEDLIAFGPAALPQVRRALRETDEEVKERARDALAALQGGPGPALRAAAARLVRQRVPAGAVPVLLAYLPFADDDAVEDEVLFALAVVAVNEGKVDGAVSAALADKNPSRRSAAALIVGRSGTIEQRAAVAPLLTDADPRVRFRAAQGLLAGRDRAALPVLITLLDNGSPELGTRALELLACVAGNRGPRVPLTEDAAVRRQCRSAWNLWWRANSRINLAKSDIDLPPFNRALQARETARQFAAAVGRGDKESLKKMAEAPFLAFGNRVLRTREEMEKFLDQELPFQPGFPLIFNVHGLFSVDEYLRVAQPVEKTFLTRLKRAETRVLCAQWQMPGRGGDAYYLILHVAGEGPPRVLGFGQINDLNGLLNSR
jgi:hypothetical protein